MEISFDQAKAFCTVVECGGYTQAAEKLHKSHSALIYLIKSLEEQCGLALFDRKGYRNKLTSSGERIYNKCIEILSKVDELQMLCGQFKKGWEPSLKIVFDGILPFDPFLQLYKKIKSENIPTIIQTYTDYLEDVEKSFYALKADILISILPIDKKDLQAYPLKSFKTHLVAHKDHPIHKSHKRWSTQDLHSFDFLTIRGSGQKLGLNTDDFEKSASFFLSDFTIKKEAILKKTGFGWLPQHLIESELKSKTLVPVKWDRDNTHKIQPSLYVSSRKEVGAATKLVIDFLNQF